MNIYISKIKSISYQNKYTNWYVSIVNNALNREIDKTKYYEKHHIIPKSFKMGGEKDKLNLVHLTAREHFIVHILLVKMVNNELLKNKMLWALTRMMGNNFNNSRTYTIAKIIFSKNKLMHLDETKQKSKETCLEKYGVEYASQSDQVRKKTKKTNLKKFGCENPFQSNIIKEKIKKTNLKKFGCEYPSQNEIIKNKKKSTLLQNYGVEYAFQSKNIREKSKQTNLQKYGVEHSSQSEEVQKKRKQTNLQKYGVDIYSKTPEARKRAKQVWANKPILICPHCGLTGKGPNMKRYHFDNCKKKPKD